MSKIMDKILYRITNSKFKAFSCSDFADFGNYKIVSKSLERLEDEGKLKRARRGIYYFKKNNNIFGIDEPVDIYEVARAIARQYNWNIVPSGNYALNVIGLSTQVPSKYIFISSGPYNQYEVGKSTIIFKHSTSKEISSLPYKALIVIQALKAIGKDKASTNDLKKIGDYLDQDDRNELVSNNIKITSWIYDELQKVIKETHKNV